MKKNRLALECLVVMLALVACASAGCSAITCTTEHNDYILFTTIATLDGSEVKTIARLDPQTTSDEAILLNTELLYAENPVWSTAHERILYTVRSEQGTTSLWIIDTSGSNSRLVASDLPFSAGMNWGEWSFDDQYVAFRPSVEDDLYHTAFELHIQQVGEITNTLTVIPDVWAYAWAPSDHRIAALVRGSEEISLRIFQPDGAIDAVFSASHYPIVKTTTPALSWSPDGRRILLIGQPDQSESSGKQTSVEELYVLDIESGKVRQLTNSQHRLISRSLSCISWSPNGRWISFVANYKANDGEEGVHRLFVAELEDGLEAQLATDVHWSCPVWSPDGQEIAFVSTRDDPNPGSYGDIYAVEVATKEMRRLTDSPQPKLSLSW